MPVDPLDPRHAYQQVAAAIRERIADGTYRPGDRLPTSRQLVDEFGVAVMTARHAIRELVDEGLVISRQGSGVFVRDGAAAHPTTASREFEAVMEALDEMRGHLQNLDERVSQIESQLRPGRRATGPTKRTDRSGR